MNNTICIIPARMGSSRFPGKVLEKICGIEMLHHCFIRAKLAKCFSEVYIATPDPIIHSFSKKIGCKSIDTKNTHTRCTERIAEAITKIDDSFENVVLYQGDEPLFSPVILRVLSDYISINAERTVTFMDEITEEQAEDLNNPKVVVDLNDYASLFSRAVIPGSLKGHNEKYYKHIGVVAFNKFLLYEYAKMSEGPLERAESIDMLRFIEHSVPVKMLLCESKTIGVDTPKDLKDVEKLMAKDSYYLSYK